MFRRRGERDAEEVETEHERDQDRKLEEHERKLKETAGRLAAIEERLGIDLEVAALRGHS